MSMSTQELLEAFRCMVKIREFEKRAHELFLQGELPGFLHLYLGEEAIAAGVMATLRPDDWVSSSHRGHGHVIAKGGDIRGMMAEIYGRSTGSCKGKGGSMHIADLDLGILGANGIVGGGIPIGTGAALACQYRGGDSVAVSFFGDAASNRGTFHEAVNLAAVWDLPIVFVCENNLYGVSTCQRDHMRITDVAERGAAYGIPGMIADGNDVEAVYEAALEAVERARRGDGPTLLECKTWRHQGHFVGDPCAYRDPLEHEEWLAKDPILRGTRVLIERGLATEESIAQLTAEIKAEIDEAAEFGRRSPWPDVSELLTDVYSA
ncbi:MAG: thiamine pyrophosphate-dependent dehydrogenase E1 component subunit alpha [Thermoleophilia bacterium]